MRFFGISLGTIVIVLITAVLVRKFGSQIPLLNGISG
jgi:xanthine/uracil permease